MSCSLQEASTFQLLELGNHCTTWSNYGILAILAILARSPRLHGTRKAQRKTPSNSCLLLGCGGIGINILNVPAHEVRLKRTDLNFRPLWPRPGRIIADSGNTVWSDLNTWREIQRDTKGKAMKTCEKPFHLN